MIDLDKLIDDHWEYVKALMEATGAPEDYIEVAEFHYKSAFRHGWKHAIEELERECTIAEDDNFDLLAVCLNCGRSPCECV